MINPPFTPPRLRVLTQQGLHSIVVPWDWAGDLRIFLHSVGIRSEPPDPLNADYAIVKPDAGTDAVIIQGYLDCWHVAE